jgi:formylglycine-generating enzyme required for sulfatase activity
LYDTAGNVDEWVSDWYAPAYDAAPQTDPSGPATGTYKTKSGGSFGYDAKYGRSAGRLVGDPARPDSVIGFRLARPIK